MSKQPEWRFFANIGDADPLIHGGIFIFTDATGVYLPEIEVFEPPEEARSDEPGWYWGDECTKFFDKKLAPKGTIWRFCVEKTHDDEWYWREADAETREALLSEDLIAQCQALMDIAHCYGLVNFDQYPTEIDYWEALERYRKMGVPV